MLPFVALHSKCALVRCGITNLCVCYALLVKVCAEVFIVSFGNLYHDARIFGEEGLHDITVTTDVVEINVHTALDVGECHLKECGDETASTDVMSAVYPTAVNHLVDRVEGICEVLRVLHCGNIIAHLTKTLGKCTTAETLLVEREVDMIE